MAALALGASTAYAAEDVIGHIDGFTSDGAGHYALRGWACVTTSNVPLSVHMYVGGPVGQPNASIVGGYEANQPSEQAIADACQATGLSYRFVIPLTDDLQKSHGGQPLYVYGISTVGGPNNVLGGSGKYIVPKVAPASTSEVVYYVHTDRLGSAVVVTDTTAKTVSASDYKPYGGDATKQEKPEAPGFTGHYEDPLTGLTYMQARYYDADLGVFLSADPLSSKPGNLFNFSRYGYANANPLAFVDPTGMAACGPSISYPEQNGTTTTHHTPNTSCGGGNGGSWGGNPWGGLILSSHTGGGVIGHGGGSGKPNKPVDLPETIVVEDIPLELVRNYDCGSLPAMPPGVDLNRNIRIAQGLSGGRFTPTAIIAWTDLVRPHGHWDYKRYGNVPLKYEDFGNFNYGATGMAIGFSPTTLLAAAGVVQVYASRTSHPNWGNPFTGSPYGDDPLDQYQIQKGIDYYQSCGN